MGLRSVTLGHAYQPVINAAARQLPLGTNFGRPSPIEVECAEQFLGLVPTAEMVKFCKDGSDAMDGAIRLARAYTGRDFIAICGDHPFHSTADWFIGTTPMPAGIPEWTRSRTLKFAYNDRESVERLMGESGGRIACVVLEAARLEEPRDNFLSWLQETCRRHGALLVFDEMITGFRWHKSGVQHVYGVQPDLSAFGKAMANGFSVSALAGRRDVMRLGGLDHDGERVFLLSTTHGAETHVLAAAIATMETYRDHDVVGHLYRQGERLRAGVTAAAQRAGVEHRSNAWGGRAACCSAHTSWDGRARSFAPCSCKSYSDAAFSHFLCRELLAHRWRYRPDHRGGGRGAGRLSAGARQRRRKVPCRSTGETRLPALRLTTCYA